VRIPGWPRLAAADATMVQSEAMNALRYRDFGGPDKVKVEMVGTPKAAPGEVLVRVRWAGLNFADYLTLTGNYPAARKPPAVLGFEAAGEIEALGEGVTLAKGARVAFISPGAFAELVPVPADKCIPIPDGMDFESAAAIPVQGLTAWGLLDVAHRLRAGEKILIHSAAGGTGLLAVQMAKGAGAIVYGTVSTAAKAAKAKAMGCDAVIIRPQADFAAEVMALTKNEGVDLVLDAIGKDTLAKDFEVLAPFGRVLLYGMSSGSAEMSSMDTLWKGSKGIGVFDLQDLMRQPKLAHDAFEAVAGAVASGNLKLTIGGKYHLNDAAAALKILGERTNIGKLILQVG